MQSVNRFDRLAVVCLALAGACTGEIDRDEERIGVASSALTAADCPAGYNVVQGTSAANTLNGTAGNDCILGLGGNDTIRGLGGNDFLIGGLGNDKLYGGDGNDTLHGEEGTDRLEGQNHDDTLHGGIAVDTMLGGSGNDALYGGDSNDSLEGGTGNDVLYGGNGLDGMSGGDGEDRLFGDAGDDKLYGDAGNDVLNGGANNDECWAGDGHDVVTGGTGNDLLVGEEGDDFLADNSGTNTIHGGDAGSDSCTGFSCELASPTVSGCTLTTQCAAAQTCVADAGMCLPCGTVGGSGCNVADDCPSDPNKTEPGICGCGVADTDSDGDGTANCNDACASDPNKIVVGICGCGVTDTDSDADGTANCLDACPADPGKITLGVCGCGIADTDSDADGTANCLDVCPSDPAKIAAGICGCGVADTDSDNDGAANCNDACPSDPAKIAVGACGCGVADIDSDSDGTANCNDLCPSDPNKVAAGTCGCGIAEIDADNDGTANCNDLCPSDPNKVAAGVCGCGVTDTDSDADGTANCLDACPADPGKITVGVCGCGIADTDSDADGTANCLDVCPSDPAKIAAGICGCGVADTDSDNDGAANCNDACPSDPAKVAVGACGCGVADIDSDSDGTANCNDLCPSDPSKVAAGTCGCGVAETDTDNDGTANCNDLCPSDPAKVAAGACGCGLADTDSDNDGTANCNDACANNPYKVAPGSCGCETLDVDDDSDGVLDCDDLCVGYPDSADADNDSIPDGCDVFEGECTASSTGPGVLAGNVVLNGPITLLEHTYLRGKQCIAGWVEIRNTNLVDLTLFETIRGIGGDLIIDDNAQLTSVAGLENISHIGGGLVVTDNPALTNLENLLTLDQLANGPPTGYGLTIDNNAQLPPCWVDELEDLTTLECRRHLAAGGSVPCGGNSGTGTCPSSVPCLPGATGPGIYAGDAVITGATAASTLASLAGIRCITGELQIFDTSLTNIDALTSVGTIAGGLTIAENAQLTNVDGLNNLVSTGNWFVIEGNDALANLAGLSRLESIGTSPFETTFFIADNPQLPACWQWLIEEQTGMYFCFDPGGSGADCSGNTGVGSCGALPPGFVCEPGAVGPGVLDSSLFIGASTGAADLAEVGGVTCITGDVWITNTALSSFPQLSALEQVGGYLYITSNSALTDLDDFSALTRIGGSLDIENNGVLQNLAGLTSLESLGDADPDSWLAIGSNAQLPACWLEIIELQLGITCVSSEYCVGNDGTGGCGSFVPVVLNESDKSEHVHLSDDELELRIGNTQNDGGVRSTEGVASGSGVWYFEMSQIGITGNGFFGAGVGTAAESLTTTIGSSTQSVGITGGGIVWFDGNFVGNFGHSDTLGFVVDYRGANPIVHIIAYEWDVSAVRHKRTLPVTVPVFAMFVGQAAHHGEIARFNFGADTENHPFVHDAVAALTDAGDAAVASELVLGFGRTRALPHSDPPVLMVDSDLSIAVNTPVTLHATAIDTEDGSLTSEILWENMAESYYVRQRGSGNTFTFTPTEIGKYPVRVLVKDSTAIVTEETIMVTVTGTLPQFDPVQMVIDSDTGAGISLSPDALSAHFTINEKMAVRANQGNYGRFWYFEARVLSDPSFSLGTGLVVSKGSLNPLSFFTTQPSLEVNFLGSAWRDLVFQANVPSPTGYYGFAVDYRGDHPIVYVIVGTSVIFTITLDHVWVPIYPMLYGNSAPGPYDNVANFGATPFQFDPAAALTNAAVSTTGFQPYWGDANAP